MKENRLIAAIETSAPAGALMVGATLTQVFVLHSILWITPAFLLVAFALVARGRWSQTRALLSGLRPRPAGKS